MRAATLALGVLFVLTLVGQLTVGKENDFGFACFIVWVLTILGLLGVGVRALLQRRRA